MSEIYYIIYNIIKSHQKEFSEMIFLFQKIMFIKVIVIQYMIYLS